MMTLAQFTTELRKLGHAFGKEVSGEMTVQYYQSLGKLSESQVGELFRWAIDNLDVPFPRVAMLIKYATEQGWFRRDQTQSGRRDYFVIMACPRCGAGCAVKRSQLESDAKADKAYPCVNGERWGCKGVIKADEVLANEKKVT